MKKMVSPCISVCYIPHEGGLCKGCFRTRDEISRWSDLDYDKQKMMLAVLRKRRKKIMNNSPIVLENK